MNLKNNKHLKEVEKILNDWDEGKGFLQQNDMHGVDLIAPIDIKELGLDIEEEEIIEILDAHYEDSDFYFRHNMDDYHEFALISSSCEDIFITYDNRLVFPSTLGADSSSKEVKLSSDNREIEIVAYTLEWMHEHGCFPSIYETDYNGYPTHVKYYEWDEYKSLSSNETKQVEEVTRLVHLIQFQKQLEENTLRMCDIPTVFFDAMPSVLQNNDGLVEVLTIDDFDAYTLTFEFAIEDIDEEDFEEVEKLVEKKVITNGTNLEASYKIKLSLLPNSVRFLKGLDDDDSLGLMVA